MLGDQAYGVGMPIMITFSSPVTHKAAVEKAIQITTSKPVVGAWMWDGDESLTSGPRSYWPAAHQGELHGALQRAGDLPPACTGPPT